MSYVGGYCLSLDMTGMCFIGKNREKAFPWDLGKGFDTSTPVSRFISTEELDNPHDIPLICRVNGQLRQSQSTADLLFGVRINMFLLWQSIRAMVHQLLFLDSTTHLVCVQVYDARAQRSDIDGHAEGS